VECALELICDPNYSDPDQIEDTIDKLPHELEDLYQGIFKKIGQERRPNEKLLAERTIKWLLCLKTPISSKGFIAGICANSNIDPSVVSVKRVLSACHHLVVFNKGIDQFDFSHFSVVEFIKNACSQEENPTADLYLYDKYNMLQAHATVAEMCLHILMAGEHLHSDAHSRWYATLYWAPHCADATSERIGEGSNLRKLFTSFLEKRLESSPYHRWREDLCEAQDNKDSWPDRVHFVRKYFRSHGDNETLSRGTLILASVFNFTEVVERILGEGDENLDIDHALFEAARCGSNEVVASLLHKGADVHYKNKGRSALSYAAEAGHETVIRLLLKSGADANRRDDEGHLPILYATLDGHTRAVDLLVKKGTNSKENNEEPLLYAAAKGHLEVALIFLEGGAKVDCKDRHGRTPLILASANGKGTMVDVLLGKGAEPNCQDITGGTSLLYAAQNGHQPVVEILLNHGASPNMGNNDHRTPLMCAAGEGHEAVVELLLQAKADPNAKCSDNVTPLMYALGQPDQKANAIVELLLDNRADPNSNDSQGRTPLLYAGAVQNQKGAELLLENGANINATDNSQVTALHWVARVGDKSFLSMLLEQGANVDMKDIAGGIPLSWAIENHYPGAHDSVAKIRMLLEKNPQVNFWYKDIPRLAGGYTGASAPTYWEKWEKDDVYFWPHVVTDHKPTRFIELKRIFFYTSPRTYESERTPLLRAAEEGDEKVVHLLLKNGAGPEVQDSNGRTPLLLAAVNGHDAVVELLLQSDDVDANVGDVGGRTPLSWAVTQGHRKVIGNLLNSGKVDVNKGDKNGATPLHCAAGNPYSSVVKRLLAADGIKVSPQDVGGLTPLSWAAGYGFALNVQLLLDTNGVDPEMKDHAGRTPFDWAKENGRRDIMELLESCRP
jgi:ankyrin repeat protein